MAGIGFELRKILAKPGYLNTLRAYGYAALISSGPWVLSIVSLSFLGIVCRGMASDKQMELVFSSVTYPMIDFARGGSTLGVLDALNQILDITFPAFNNQGGTLVVPGHGRICNESDVAEYRDMTTIIRDRIRMMIDKGMTLAQVKAAGPSRDYDGVYSTPAWTGEMFVETIYTDLTRARLSEVKRAVGRSGSPSAPR